MIGIIGTMSAYAGVIAAALAAGVLASLAWALRCAVRGRREARRWKEGFGR